MMKAVLALLFVVHVGLVRGHPDGAPSGVCQTMTPNHQVTNVADQNIDIQVEPHQDCYKEGTNIMVLVTPPKNTLVKGLLAVGRQVDGADTTAYGTWNAGAKLKVVDCFGQTGSGLTHSERINTYGAVGLMWEAPATVQNPKDINFKVTVVSVKDKYWVARSSMKNITYSATCQQSVYDVPKYQDTPDSDNAAVGHVITLPFLMMCAALTIFINKLL